MESGQSDYESDALDLKQANTDGFFGRCRGGRGGARPARRRVMRRRLMFRRWFALGRALPFFWFAAADRSVRCSGFLWAMTTAAARRRHRRVVSNAAAAAVDRARGRTSPANRSRPTSGRRSYPFGQPQCLIRHGGRVGRQPAVGSSSVMSAVLAVAGRCRAFVGA
jgi:hypothetical protein